MNQHIDSVNTYLTRQYGVYNIKRIGKKHNDLIEILKGLAVSFRIKRKN